jgi:hypothetical protein
MSAGSATGNKDTKIWQSKNLSGNFNGRNFILELGLSGPLQL